MKHENQQAWYSLIFSRTLTNLIIKFYWRRWNILGFNQKQLDDLTLALKVEILSLVLIKASHKKVFYIDESLKGSFWVLYFLLYVSDMKSEVKDCNFRLYTDDAKLIFSNQNVISIKKYLNVDFNSLQTINCSYIRRKIKLNAFYSKRERNSTPP